jgi:CubicO group peptidase (beta-lactamase class C family)
VERLKSRFDIEELERFLLKQVEAAEFSGCVLVAEHEKVLFRKAHGFASRRFNAPNRVDTKFNLGSVNKIFTKVAIMQLVEQDALSFDDYIEQHLPNYPAKVANKVTINHLLNHTSGMGHYWNEKFKASKDNLRTVDDFLNLFIDDPLSFSPGQKFEYSNAGYVVLGKIIEVVSGQDYFNYVREHIYKKAGMKYTDHYEMDLSTPNLAIGYTKTDLEGNPTAGPRRNNLFMFGVKGSPAGGGYSTVDDMLRFCIALIHHKLLSSKYTKLFLTPSRKRPAKKRQLRVFGHAGGGPGIGAIFEMYLDLNYIDIILSNYDPDSMWAVSEKIKSIIVGSQP